MTVTDKTRVTHISELPNPSIQKGEIVACYTIPVTPRNHISVSSAEQLINLNKEKSEEMYH